MKKRLPITTRILLMLFLLVAVGGAVFEFRFSRYLREMNRSGGMFAGYPSCFRYMLKDMWVRVDSQDYRIWDDGHGLRDIDSKRPLIPRSWLSKKCGISEVESMLSEYRQKRGESWYSPEWEEEIVFLLGQVREGDKLYWFKSPEYTWNSLVGRAGVALVRDRKPIAGIVTEMN